MVYVPPKYQWNPAEVRQVGVVLDGVFYTVEHRDPRRGAPLAILHREECKVDRNQAGAYAFFAATYHTPVVWVLERDRAVMELDPHDVPAEAFTWHNLSDDDVICGYVAQRKDETGKGKGVPYNIFFPGVRDAWSVGAYLDDPHLSPVTLASGVALAAFTLDNQLRYSPGYVGNTLLRRRLAKWEAWQAAYAKEHGTEPKTVLQLSDEWRHRFLHEIRATPVQRVLRHIPAPTSGDTVTIHVYDRNWSYVSSAREIPNGDPIATDTFVKGCPGVYLVSNMRSIEEWVWEPELRNGGLGHGLYITEGYYWPKDRVIDLRVWNDDMWKARKAARAVDSLAGKIGESIIKDAGRAAIGKLAQHTGRGVVSALEAREQGLRILSHVSNEEGQLTGDVEVEMALGRSDLIMPHWWSNTIANANERLWNAIATFAPDDTILAYVDQFYCLQMHTEPDAKGRTLHGDPMTRGGWKYSGRFQVDASQLERLNSMGAQDMVKAFARLQREGV